MSGKVGSFKIIFLIILAGFPGKCLPSKIPYFNKVLSKNLDYPRNPSKVLDDGGREEDYSEDFVDIDMEAFAEIFGDDDAGESEEKDEAGRIIGGHEAARGQFPFVVGLWRKRGSRPFCGGSLITSRWVLTAAHCVYGKNFFGLKIMIGDHDVRRKDEGETQKDVCRIRIHPYYANHHITDDLALLELCSPVKFSPEIQPIAIANPEIDLKLEVPKEEPSEEQEETNDEEEHAAEVIVEEAADDDDDKEEQNENEEAEEQGDQSEEDDDDRGFGNGKDVTVAGWGTLREGGSTARKLRYVQVRAIPNQHCLRSYPWVTDSQLCAGLRQGGKDSCQGDSGGPLWWQNPETQRRILVGIVSNGRGCARPGYPGVYTRVSKYFTWILETMARKDDDP